MPQSWPLSTSILIESAVGGTWGSPGSPPAHCCRNPLHSTLREMGCSAMGAPCLGMTPRHCPDPPPALEPLLCPPCNLSPSPADPSCVLWGSTGTQAAPLDPQSYPQAALGMERQPLEPVSRDPSSQAQTEEGKAVPRFPCVSSPSPAPTSERRHQPQPLKDEIFLTHRTSHLIRRAQCKMMIWAPVKNY